MKTVILSILGSILLTSFIIGLFVFMITSHAELLSVSGIILLLIIFYCLIKWFLEDIEV